MVFKPLVLFTSGSGATCIQRHSAPYFACLHFGAFHPHSRSNSLRKKREEREKRLDKQIQMLEEILKSCKAFQYT